MFIHYKQQNGVQREPVLYRVPKKHCGARSLFAKIEIAGIVPGVQALAWLNKEEQTKRIKKNIHTIFSDSIQTCNSSYIGYNFLFGSSHCKTYSDSVDFANANLIREIRSGVYLIPQFNQSQLDLIVHHVSTL